MKNNYCQLYLTCADKAEAGKISKTLLVKHLIACAKQRPISSQFSWQGKIESEDEVLVVMDSRTDLFEQVEAEVAKIHSYDVFALQAVPLAKISSKAQKWLGEELKNV